jgi:hypothetical protein
MLVRLSLLIQWKIECQLHLLPVSRAVVVREGRSLAEHLAGDPSHERHSLLVTLPSGLTKCHTPML